MLDSVQFKAMKQRSVEAEYIVKQFSAWYSDNGCPWSEHEFCPNIDELKADYDKEMEDENEEDRYPFSPEDDCSYICECGGCYAEYYRKLFRDKK
jgi:hypothetical protein